MGLRAFLDKIKPAFEKGGKFEKLHSTFDAFETFLYVPDTVTENGSHIRDAVDMKRNMIFVMIALMPCFFFGIFNVGYQHFLSSGENVTFWHTVGYGLIKVIPMYNVSYIFGVAIEFIFAEVRHEQVNEGYFVTGFLIPLIMPPDIPLWMLAIAVAFAVIIGKEVFGGTGMNIVNPALLARAFLFFSYPSKMSGDDIWIADKPDAYSGATPLGELLNGSNVMESLNISDMFFGFMPGSVGETSKLAILTGGMFLILTQVISLRILLSVFAGAIIMSLTFNLIGSTPAMEVTFWQHFLIGGFLFGAFFMATDPVTAAQTNTGKIIYGFLVGAIAIMIRVINQAYPEGMMLSILLMNFFAPFIDYVVVNNNIRKRKRRLAKTERRSS